MKITLNEIKYYYGADAHEIFEMYTMGDNDSFAAIYGYFLKRKPKSKKAQKKLDETLRAFRSAEVWINEWLFKKRS